VYVALTRARHTLVIHTNRPSFDRFRVEGLETVHDGRPYAPADEVCYRLTHEDVYLSGFRHPKVAAAVDGLRAGASLPFGYDPDGRPFLRLPNGCTLRFSYGFEATLAAQAKTGYAITACGALHRILARRGSGPRTQGAAAVGDDEEAVESRQLKMESEQLQELSPVAVPAVPQRVYPELRHR
jgi:hypothetical protein